MQQKRVRLPWQMYQVFAEYPVEEVLPLTWLTPEEHNQASRTAFVANGLTFYPKMYSLRYITFRKSLACVKCGLVGSVMRLEMTRGSRDEIPHFNLYARNEHGHLVLMTKDHIYPKSKGGRDIPENMQTMCEHCNGKKKDLIPEEYRDEVPKHLVKSTV